MTRLTRGVGTALPAFALILSLLPPPAVAAAHSDWPCQWDMYGGGPARTFEYTCPSNINRLSAVTLVPAWLYKTTGTVTASPVVVDGKLYVGDWSGTMYAFDAGTGALIWNQPLWDTPTKPAPGAAFGPIVSSAAVADVVINDVTKRLVIVGSGPRLYALDALSAEGEIVWVSDFGKTPDDPTDADDPNDPTEIESSPVVWNGKIYVGIDTHDRPADEAFGISGGLLVVDATNGDLIWKFDPELGIRTDMTGNPYIPSEVSPYPSRTGCGGIWGSPAIDTSTATVYFGTANCQTEDPAGWDTPHAEAITALDANTGSVKWTFQPHDDFNHADWDFGATPNLFRDATGRKVVGAGNKDGSYYLLDAETGTPAQEPDLLWSTHAGYGDPVGDDFAIGGFIGSTAVAHVAGGDDERVAVVGTTALGPPIGEDGVKLYYHGLDAEDGSNMWVDPVTGQIPTGGIGLPSYAASATVNGVAFAGALDNLFKAYDVETGAILWTAPLLGPISSGPAIVGDTVYVGSGTSSSDLCAKDAPGSEACFALFDAVLGSLGGVHAFRLVPLPY